MRLRPNYARAMMLTLLIVVAGMIGVLRRAHQHHPAHAASLHPTTLPHSQGRRGSSRRVGGGGYAAGDHYDTSVGHEGGAGSDPQAPLAVYSDLLRLFVREFTPAPMMDENVLALCSAPRGPSLARGPPSIS